MPWMEPVPLVLLKIHVDGILAKLRYFPFVCVFVCFVCFFIYVQNGKKVSILTSSLGELQTKHHSFCLNY